MDAYLIDDPKLSQAYLVKNADDVEEAVEAVVEAEPRYYDSALGITQYATNVSENPEALDRRDFPLGQPKVIDLAE